MSTVAIVIPAYNEEATLETVVRGCVDVFEGDERLREIVIVDDVSTDRTPDVVRALAELDQRVKPVRNGRQLGCVPSVLRGFDTASTDFVFFLPADGQILPDVVRRCLDVADERGHDVVLTRRAGRDDPWYRIALSAVYNRLIRLIMPGFPASDIDSVCLFRRSVIEGHRPPDEATAFALVELVLTAQRRGASIGEIEIAHFPRAGGRAHGIRPREIVAGAKGLLTLLRWRLASR